MAPAIVTATVQAAVLSATSNVLAQALQAYRSGVRAEHSSQVVNDTCAETTIIAIIPARHRADPELRHLHPHQHTSELFMATVTRR